MKIQKFNESKEPTKKLHICMVINSESTADYSGIFNTEEDMNNWLLNIVNNLIIDRWQDDGRPKLFIDVSDAINWLQDENECNVYYDNDTEFYNNVKLKYGAETIRNIKKYNI